MSQKKAVPTDDELSAMFAGIGADDESESVTSLSTNTNTNTKPTPSSTDNEDDPLAELASLAAAPRAVSRPSTPRIASSAATSTGRRSGDAVHTPSSTGSGRSSVEKSRSSGEGARVVEQKRSRTPATASTPTQQTSPIVARAATPQSPPAPAATKSGGSWWGGFSAIASAAVKQAEAAVKEIQKNEEAQKWAEQVKGNVGALRGLGMRCSFLETQETLESENVADNT